MNSFILRSLLNLKSILKETWSEEAGKTFPMKEIHYNRSTLRFTNLAKASPFSILFASKARSIN